MPNLEYFKFYCISKDIKEDFYKKFVQKIISLKLDKLKYVNFIVKKSKDNYHNVYYSLDELIAIFPTINKKKLNKIYIRKFTSD